MIFGLSISCLPAELVADEIRDISSVRCAPARAVVTPNIQHIAEMQRSDAFRGAMQAAYLVLPDGFPLVLYGRLRGLGGLRRVTGREVTLELLGNHEKLRNRRILFVVDSLATKENLERWQDRCLQKLELLILVAEGNFAPYSEQASEFIDLIADFCPSIIFMCIGAPSSEVFAYRCTKQLYGFWILCVGQSVRLFLGMNPKVPKWIEDHYLEWLWRIWSEPRRLIPRYLSSIWPFLKASIFDFKK